jgi:hypothetical protein
MTGRHAAPRKRTYEDDDFAKCVGRLITAMERRAGTNPDALAYMMDLQDLMRDAVNRAGVSLHADAGFSLGDIARFLSLNGHPMTRQNAVKRWGPASVARKLLPVKVAEVINLSAIRAKKARAEVWGDVEVNRRDAI